VQLGRLSRFAIQADDAQNRSGAAFGDNKVELTVVTPRADAPSGGLAAALQDRLAGPWHPWEQLGTRLDDGLMETLRMYSRHGLEG
jgi:hypothetical protein